MLARNVILLPIVSMVRIHRASPERALCSLQVPCYLVVRTRFDWHPAGLRHKGRHDACLLPILASNHPRQRTLSLRVLQFGLLEKIPCGVSISQRALFPQGAASDLAQVDDRPAILGPRVMGCHSHRKLALQVEQHGIELVVHWLRSCSSHRAV